MTEEEERLELYGKCIVCCAYVNPLTPQGFSKRFSRCSICWDGKTMFEQHKPIPPVEWDRNGG